MSEAVLPGVTLIIMAKPKIKTWYAINTISLQGQFTAYMTEHKKVRIAKLYVNWVIHAQRGTVE
jgi:hypothetical protein